MMRAYLSFSFALISIATNIVFAKPFSKTEGWDGLNKKRLEQFIRQYGSKSRSYNPQHKPVAIFDWDNTVIKNDIGEAVMYWMLSHGMIKKPQDWEKTSPYLSSPMIRTLEKNCGSLSDPLPTHLPIGKNCADTILSLYIFGEPEKEGLKWRRSFNRDAIHPAVAWTAQLMAGYTSDEIRTMAQEAIKWSLNNSIGTTQVIGSRTVPAYLRIYEQMHALIEAFQFYSIDVWVVSGTVQYIVEEMAKKVGIASDHVIGLRPSLDAEGKITYFFESCGTHKARPGEPGIQSLITYRQGKQCWINRVVFGVQDPGRMMYQPSPIQFAAGDSDGDVFFLSDAEVLKLVIDHPDDHETEIHCAALENKGGGWLINSPFIR